MRLMGRLLVPCSIAYSTVYCRLPVAISYSREGYNVERCTFHEKAMYPIEYSRRVSCLA